MVGSLKQDVQGPPETEEPEQNPQDRNVIQEMRGAQRPTMAKVQERTTQPEGKTPPGKRRPELGNQQETTREFKVQLQLLRLQAESRPQQEKDDKKQCVYPAEIKQLEGDGSSHGKSRCVEQHLLHVKLHDMQDMLEQKQHEEMCKTLQEMQRQAEEISSLHIPVGGTDLEKHRDLLVSENGRLRQELQRLRSQLDCENNQELASLRERLQHMEQEESERKALIHTLQQEVQQKAERLSEAELRVRDSVRERVEEEERLNRKLRECQLSQQPQIKVWG